MLFCLLHGAAVTRQIQICPNWKRASENETNFWSFELFNAEKLFIPLNRDNFAIWHGSKLIPFRLLWAAKAKNENISHVYLLDVALENKIVHIFQPQNVKQQRNINAFGFWVVFGVHWEFDF